MPVTENTLICGDFHIWDHSEPKQVGGGREGCHICPFLTAVPTFPVCPYLSYRHIRFRLKAEAVKYDEISIQEVIDQKLAAVDLTASILCLENKMPMLVFGLNEENSIVETMSGNFTGTKVTV